MTWNRLGKAILNLARLLGSDSELRAFADRDEARRCRAARDHVRARLALTTRLVG